MTPLLDIFSPPKFERKIKKREKSKIIIDKQEKNSLVISKLIQLGLIIEFQHLKVGDYLVNGIAIERKTVLDFLSSMKNRRLLKQLEELQQYPKKLLIIEGIDEQELYTDSKDNASIHSNAIRGFLLSILLNYKVPIVYTKDYEDTAKFIDVLSRKKSKEISLNVTKKSLSSSERIQFILEGFPGIGPKTSKKLFKEFRTLQNIANASELDLQRTIGKKAEIFKKLITYEYSGT